MNGSGLKRWQELLPFLGSVLGKTSEVLLETPDQGIIAVENGSILGHDLGDPITTETQLALDEGKYLEDNYSTSSIHDPHSGKPVRCWRYFVKDETDNVEAVLTIYTDLSDYLSVIESLSRLVGNYTQSEQNIPVEKGNKRGAVSSGLIEMGLSHVEPHRLTDSERQKLIEILFRHGVFEAKGAVSETASQLGVSDASIYRYLTAATRNEKKNKRATQQKLED